MIRISIMLYLCLVSISTIFAMGVSDKQETRNSQFEGISSVQIEGVFCDIAYTGTDSSLLKMEVIISDSQTKVRQTAENGRLHVWIERDWSFSSMFKGTNRISFVGPKEIKFDVNNASGAIRVRDIASGRMNLRTASGSIHVEEVKGKLEITTASGSIKVENSDGDIAALSMSGSQTLSNFKGAIQAHSKSGSISIKSGGGDIEANTVSGGIELALTEGSLACTTTSGSIRGQDLTLTEHTKFVSVSGGIDCHVLNLQNCKFNLITTSGSLAVGSSRGGKRLSIGNGSIDVSATSVSGSIRFN
jgi:DUF4097 and DUF4098 domain-containing protein YvlB